MNLGAKYLGDEMHMRLQGGIDTCSLGLQGWQDKTGGVSAPKILRHPPFFVISAWLQELK